jgi:hypothetical protein
LSRNLDGTAKGGVLAALAAARGSSAADPVHRCRREGIDDLQPFSASEFADALLGLGSDSVNLAAVDLGPNSLRLEIGRAEGTHVVREGYWKKPCGWQPVSTKPTSSAKSRSISRWKPSARMNERIRGMPPQQVRAVGTQTLRLARNSNDFLVERRTRPAT